MDKTLPFIKVPSVSSAEHPASRYKQVNLELELQFIKHLCYFSFNHWIMDIFFDKCYREASLQTTVQRATSYISNEMVKES